MSLRTNLQLDGLELSPSKQLLVDSSSTDLATVVLQACFLSIVENQNRSIHSYICKFRTKRVPKQGSQLCLLFCSFIRGSYQRTLGSECTELTFPSLSLRDIISISLSQPELEALLDLNLKPHSIIGKMIFLWLLCIILDDTKLQNLIPVDISSPLHYLISFLVYGHLFRLKYLNMHLMFMRSLSNAWKFAKGIWQGHASSSMLTKIFTQENLYDRNKASNFDLVIVYAESEPRTFIIED